MFKVVIIVSLLVSGQPHTFALTSKEAYTEAECKAYPKSDKFKVVMKSLRDIVPKGGKITTTVSCAKSEEEKI